METTIQAIARLKKERKAVILAHTYQGLDVQDVADFVGDSLELSRRAQAAPEATIVFCGVRFMAETAKLLSPGKTVLLPSEDAGCFMADTLSAEALRAFKAEHPGRPVVTYINSTAEVKAESDICCTSANALRVVESLQADEVLFVPDRNLAAWVARNTGKRVIAWNGFCPVHARFSVQEARAAREAYPEAVFLAHPECDLAVLDMADEVLSTSGILAYVKKSGALSFLIATEAEVVQRLARDYPDRSFRSIGAMKFCVNMKKTRLEDLRRSLETMAPAIEIPEPIAEAARRPIERMLAL